MTHRVEKEHAEKKENAQSRSTLRKKRLSLTSLLRRGMVNRAFQKEICLKVGGRRLSGRKRKNGCKIFLFTRNYSGVKKKSLTMLL